MMESFDLLYVCMKLCAHAGKKNHNNAGKELVQQDEQSFCNQFVQVHTVISQIF